MLTFPSNHLPYIFNFFTIFLTFLTFFMYRINSIISLFPPLLTIAFSSFIFLFRYCEFCLRQSSILTTTATFTADSAEREIFITTAERYLSFIQSNFSFYNLSNLSYFDVLSLCYDTTNSRRWYVYVYMCFCII